MNRMLVERVTAVPKRCNLARELECSDKRWREEHEWPGHGVTCRLR